MSGKRTIPLSDLTDTTNYALAARPSALFVPEVAYDGGEVIRRLRAWEQVHARTGKAESRW